MLEVNGLSKRFGGLKALSDVSFSIRAGEIMSLIGPNGAGKTTCLNLVTGFLRPSGGSVRYGDREITGIAPHAAAQMGLIRTFQKTNVLRGLTVFGNVLTARYRHGERSFFAPFSQAAGSASVNCATKPPLWSRPSGWALV
jgi:branched-chain amino acid transport system ATP-binding protein